MLFPSRKYKNVLERNIRPYSQVILSLQMAFLELKSFAVVQTHQIIKKVHILPLIFLETMLKPLMANINCLVTFVFSRTKWYSYCLHNVQKMQLCLYIHV